MARGQPVANKANQHRIVEQRVDGIEQVILEQRGLREKRREEQRGLACAWPYHILDTIEYDTRCASGTSDRGAGFSQLRRRGGSGSAARNRRLPQQPIAS